MEKVVFSARELGRIKKNNLKKLEQQLDVKLIFSEGSITIESRKQDGFAEYIAARALEALAFGFKLETALQLQNTDYIFRKIDIKASRGKTTVIAGRIIGTQGKIKTALEKASECKIVVKDHFVGILGKTENVEIVSRAIFAIIRGAPQSRVVGHLKSEMARLKSSEESVEEMIEK